MLRELRFPFRMLLMQPGFSLIAALTLALGIGATSAVLQFDSGRVAYTAAISEAGATRADSYSAHRWTEDGQPARLGGATVDGVAEGRDVVRGNRRV
jgi:hypothetical protein